jgi:hypothetical protein
MSDIIFVNGYIGMQCKITFTQYFSETSDFPTGGNQQFTTRGLNFLSTKIAIWMLWDWGWTCKFPTNRHYKTKAHRYQREIHSNRRCQLWHLR